MHSPATVKQWGEYVTPRFDFSRMHTFTTSEPGSDIVPFLGVLLRSLDSGLRLWALFWLR